MGGYENTWGNPYGKPRVNTQGFPPEETPEEKQGENPGYVESPPGETPGEKWPPLGKSGGPPTFPPEEKWGGLENTWGNPTENPG